MANARDVFVALGPDLTINWISPSVRGHLGHEPADLVGVRLPELITATYRPVLESFLEDSFNALSAELRLQAGLLYAEGRDAFTHKKTVGQPGGAVADTLAPSGPPLSLLFNHRVYIFGEPEAESSPAKLGLFPRPASAALLVGRRPKRHAIFFLLGDGWVREELDFTLNTLRAAPTPKCASPGAIRARRGSATERRAARTPAASRVGTRFSP